MVYRLRAPPPTAGVRFGVRYCVWMCQSTYLPTNHGISIPRNLFNIMYALRIVCTILNWTISRTRKFNAILSYWYQPGTEQC